MIVVHEFGHFLVAKLCGVRVERFSIGFPPRLFGIQIGETDYCVSAVLAGGYVKMSGENLPGENLSPEGADQEKIEADKSDPGALTAHPRWQRMLIAVAGPAANFVLALVLMLFYFGWINEVPAVEVQATTVEWVIPGSAAAQAGIEPGDTLRSFDTVKNPSWNQVYAQATMDPNQTVAVTVERGGKTLPLWLRVPGTMKGDDVAGMLPQYLNGPIGVQMVQPGTPAEKAGLRAGDAIVAVDGHRFHEVMSLLAYMQAGKGAPMTLLVKRDGRLLPPMVAHPEVLDTEYMLGFKTVPTPMHRSPLPLTQAWRKSTVFCRDNSFLIVEVLQRIFEHRVSVSQLTGPVGIAQMAGEAAEMKGWYPKFVLAGEISLNLGILNLLPFPILDGGMILFLLIESALRHDINRMIKERIYQAAFVVLVAFFAFVIFNDMTKLPIFTHLKQ